MHSCLCSFIRLAYLSASLLALTNHLMCRYLSVYRLIYLSIYLYIYLSACLCIFM